MRTTVLSFNEQKDLSNQLETLRDAPPDFVIAFLPSDKSLQSHLDTLRQYWPNSLLVGATASRQFANGNLCDGGCLHLFWFDKPNHHAWVEVIECDEAESIHTDKAFDALRDRQPEAALLLVDGIRFPIHTLLEKLRNCCVGELPCIVGGLASKNLAPEHFFDDDGAWTFVGNHIYPNAALLIGFEGVDINVHVVRGWDPASPVYTVTRAENNILHSVDGTPAAEWYREFFTLDGKMPELPAASYGFPLIIDGPDPVRKHIYRTMVAFDQPPGCVTLAGDIHTGDQVRLGLGNDSSLVSAAKQLDLKEADTCLLFSCVVREMVLGDAAATEIETLSKKLAGTPLSGFFTLGEIGPSTAGELSFYNQTGILALLTEKSG